MGSLDVYKRQVYDYAYLPKELSVENKDTKISQFDEIQQYYNGKPISNWY